MLQEVTGALDAADVAQRQWASQIVRHRLKAIGGVAGQIAQRDGELVGCIRRPNSAPAEILASEILPLADACRFTRRVGRQVLAPESHSFRHGAWWMGRIGVRTHREPWGTILILAPRNYPLFLPGVQTIQALAAGNAVAIKPAPGCEAITECFKSCLTDAGIPGDLVQILPSSIEAGEAAISRGVDKVVLTGSAATGRAVMRQLAEKLTPSTMELGGCDAAFVLPQAAPARAARAIAYALQLNGGATCIAPRRIFTCRGHGESFADALVKELSKSPARMCQVEPAVAASVNRAVDQAVAEGARIIFGQKPASDTSPQMQPLVLQHVTAQMEIAQTDLFAPISSILEVEDMPAAIEADGQCPYSLAAAVFGPKSHAEHWAGEVQAGCVVVNDVVVPTADPRVGFGGHDMSGWGLTRGAEGLLEMTRPKTICTRNGQWMPHLDEKNAGDSALLSQMLKFLHSASLSQRLAALGKIMKLARRR